MNVRHPQGVIKNIFYDKMDLRLFYFHVTICMTINFWLYFLNLNKLNLEIIVPTAPLDHFFGNLNSSIYPNCTSGWNKIPDFPPNISCSS